jgi:hypothetical protein
VADAEKTTRPDAWTRLGELTPSEVADAALEMHWAVQLVASVGQTFAEPADDDGHRAMSWHPTLHAFVGVPVAGAYPLRVGLRPADLALIILDRTDEVIAELPLPGQSLDEAYEWIGLAMATYFGGAPPTVEPPEYEMPEHPVQNGARFSTAYERERHVLSALYEAAADVLGDVFHDDASEVRCWPHHFDVATLKTEARDEDGKATKTIGVGMAPSGGGCALWYWYVSPWPHPDASAALPALTSGAWHTEGWTGAVLPGEQVVAASPDARAELVRAFVQEAIACAREVLSHQM